jgi:TRAP-type C4-dicarboxylate transport system permease large subunit
LFIVVIGGIYAGIFTAMEGGAIGAFMAFFIALVTGRLTRQRFKFALVDGGKFIVSLLFMIVGSMIFSHALAGSNLTRMLAEFIGGLTVHPLVIMGCIMLMYLLLGCITSAPIVLILTVPILAPILGDLGFDLIWVGVLLVLLTNLGVITPPYGMGVFLLKGVAKDVDLFTIYRGVLPFVVSSILVAVLILFFPSLATWLPNQMMK